MLICLEMLKFKMYSLKVLGKLFWNYPFLAASVRCCLNFNWLNRLGSVKLFQFLSTISIVSISYQKLTLANFPNKLFLLHINLYRYRCEFIRDVNRICVIYTLCMVELFLLKWKHSSNFFPASIQLHYQIINNSFIYSSSYLFYINFMQLKVV